MIYFDNKKCTGCAQCANVCPQGVIEIQNKKAILKDYESCMECGACQLNCEYGAVELTKGKGCMVAILKEDILKITPKGTGCGCSEQNPNGGCGC